MKTNTLKVLTFLYSPQAPFNAEYDHLKYVLPQLSESGLRSLVSYLARQAWLKRERRGKLTKLRLTSYGEHAVRQEMPSLSEEMKNWQGEWSLILFLKPPKHDKQFRYLRSLLVRLNLVALSRGVYLVPSSGFSKLQEELYTSYRRAVVVMTISDWTFGDQQSFIYEKYQLWELQESLSEISKAIDQLLSNKKTFSTLTEQQKTEVFSVYHRLYSLIQKDVGILKYYFTRAEDSATLLNRFHLLVQ